MYKIKKLLDDNVNFSEIYSEKQASVRDNTGLDFDLNGIVLFLQKQTNNFTIDNTIAKDLDEAIYKIYEQWNREKQPQPEEEPIPLPTEPQPEESSSEADAITSMLLIDVEQGEKDAIESMLYIMDKPKTFLLGVLKQNADYDKKNKKYIAKPSSMLSQANIDYLETIIENYQEQTS
jgi:hypothetical protein